MEETKPRPGFPGDRAQVAAEKLRALRERANQALDEHRQRLSQIESELSLRVRQLTEEFDAASTGRLSEGGRDEEVAALREQLESDRAKHDKFVEQLTAARRQLDAIQAQPCAACQDAAQQLADSQTEITRLREQVQAAERQQDEDRARHDKFAEQVAAARQAISDLQSKSHEQSSDLQSELDAARAAKTAAEEQSAALARDIEVLHAEYDALQQRAEKLEHEGAQSLDDHRVAAGAEAEILRQQVATLKAELAGSMRAGSTAEERAKSLDSQLAALRSERDDLARQAEDSQLQKTELESRLATVTSNVAGDQQANADRLAAAEAKHAELERQLSTIATERSNLADALSSAEANQADFKQQVTAAETRQSELQQQLAAVESEKSALANTLAAADARHAETQQRLTAIEAEKSVLETSLTEADAKRRELALALEESRGEIESLEKSRGDDLSTVHANLQKAQAEAAKLVQVRDEFKTLLERSQSELVQLRDASSPRAELDDLQQKFDLALADVQKLKRESGELREKLASRPAASDEASPELVALRSERDALAARVEGLEKAAASAGAASSQDTEDLHRRFEMAVDDVRQLKQENAQLRDQLANAKTSGGAGVAPSGGGANDWAAQRARLMAMLEQEDGDGPLDAARRKERASIVDAIERTDRAIAEKDRELAELRATQEAYTAGASCSVDYEREQILSADETIVAERQRLAELQNEWEQKLRAAELEFSVERAKLAREQAALKERLFDLQKSGGADAGEAKPRRSWFTALGLGEVGEESARPK